jgi:hypothetical protein
MYIGNARTLKTILSQLSDTDTFSEQRDQLVAEQQHRSFRFVLRFNDADNSYGYPSNHPLYDGYTVNGKLIDSNQQIRVSLNPKTNSFIESLREGDTLEVVASLHRWDPAYNVVEMETVLENPLSQEPALHTDKNNPSPERAVEAVQAPRHSTTLAERPTAAATTISGKQADHSPGTTSSGRSVARWFIVVGCLGCIATASMIFTYSSSAAGWAETPARLVYYRAKNRHMFITYVYTVDETEYQRTEPADEDHGAAGNYLWVVYQQDDPHTAEVSKRHNYNNLITIFTIGPLLLILLVGGWIVTVQILRTPNITPAPRMS